MFFRILLASLYDLLIILALLVLTTILCIVVNHQLPIPVGTHWYQYLLLITIIFYYLGCLSMSGQTIGLKTWQLKLVTEKEEDLTILQTFLWLILILPAINWGFLNRKNPQYFLLKWTKAKLQSLQK